MFEEDQIKQILDTLDSLNSRTRIYFGCDSIRKWKGKNWHATYATIVAIHKNANSGCALFYYTSSEIDYDNSIEDPLIVNRIMDEVGNIDYIYQVIQESVDEVTEEQYMLYQQELEDESPLVQ